MTTSDHAKMYKQLAVKPQKLTKYKKHNAPAKRSCGIALRKCKRCGRMRGHINKYHIGMCRQCFRETATSIGFKKYS